VRRGLVAESDTRLYMITDDAGEAVSEIDRFYRNYDSLRYVGDLLVMRLRHAPTDEQLAVLNDRFAHLCAAGSITRADAFEPERRSRDRLHLARIAFAFAKHRYGDLRDLIDVVNGFVPDEPAGPPSAAAAGPAVQDVPHVMVAPESRYPR